MTCLPGYDAAEIIGPPRLPWPSSETRCLIGCAIGQHRLGIDAYRYPWGVFAVRERQVDSDVDASRTSTPTADPVRADAGDVPPVAAPRPSTAGLTRLQRLAGNRAVAAALETRRGPSNRAAIQRLRTVQREALQLRSGNNVTDTSPRAVDNPREEVLPLLDRLHTLWSIDNDNYGNQHDKIVSLAANTQVPQRDPGPPAWSFQPTLDALRRNREPTLSAPVIMHYMGGLTVAGSVGLGMNNAKDDVLAVQTRLNFLAPYPEFAGERAAVESAATPTIPDSMLTGTLAAITTFKTGIASGNEGWLTVRASEDEYGGDKFAGQTASHTVTVHANHSASRAPSAETDEAIAVSIFLPGGLTDKNKVVLFFSPGDGTETAPGQPGGNATNVHALRSGADASPWILIGIPGFRSPTAERGWNTFNTAAIQSCLARAGRPTRIDGLRLIAHSRGGRGLTKTVERRLIDIGSVDQVIMLDQPHAGLAENLAAATPKGKKPPPIIDYTQGAGVKGAGTTLNAESIRAIGFARLIRDRPDVPAPAPAAALLGPIMADLPQRGQFTTATAPAAGKTNVHSWAARHTGGIAAVAAADERAQRAWNAFLAAPGTPLPPSVATSPYFHVNTQNLMRFFAGPLIDPATGAPTAGGFSLGIYAHHLFVAEFANDFFD